jgi:hypothetical protein
MSRPCLLLVALCLLLVLSGCASLGATPTPSVILPLGPARPSPQPSVASVVTATATSRLSSSGKVTPMRPNQTPEPVATLPVPQLHNATGTTQASGWAQMTLLSMGTAPVDGSLESGMQYVVVHLSFKNVSSTAHDTTSVPFAFAVGVGDPQTEIYYYSQPYSPAADNLWGLVDKLSTSATKSLAAGKTLTGSLYFQVPLTTTAVQVLWKPSVQDQYLWPLQKFTNP